MKTAKRVKTLKNFKGKAALYKLSTPLNGHRYVAVSATIAMFSGPETYIFPAYANGKVKDWNELNGSQRGTLDHAEALESAGYKLISKNEN